MKTVVYKFKSIKSCRSFKDEQRELWTLTVPINCIPVDFKLGPNARFADPGKKPVKAMLQTLESEPKQFVFYNNGIMGIAKSIRTDGDEVELTCLESETDEDGPGHGILNGGHTYLALTIARRNPDKYAEALSSAVVSFTIGIGIPEEDIWKISRARNTSEKVPVYALRELAGDWSILKQNLPERSKPLVEFKPNPESDAKFDATDLIRRLVLVNNSLYPAEQSQHPVAAYTSIGSLVRNFKPEDFKDTAHLLPDVLWLEEQVMKFYESKNGKPAKNENALATFSSFSGCSPDKMQLLSGYETGRLSMADPFVLPVIAAFRVFIVNNQWAEPINTLWDKYGERTIKSLLEAYKESKSSSASAFGRAKSSWAQACEFTKAVAIQNGYVKIELV